MYIRSLFLFSLVLFLNSCTTVPEVNPSWIKANCQSPGYQVYDTKEYSNCVRTSKGIYYCNYSNGNYVGKLKQGDNHGKGIYKWNDGTVYEGQWRNGEKWCGIQKKGNNFATYTNGTQTSGKAGVDWGAVAAGVLIAGAVYAVAEAASDSGSSGNSNTRRRTSSPVECSYTLNNKTIKIDNPNYSWGSCPSDYTYKHPLMCSSTYSYASPKCDIGKACGNTCISSYNTCHVGRGSACNLNSRSYP